MLKVDDDIIQRIKSGDSKAFEAVFNEYYQPLVNLATSILKDPENAEEKVQEVFVRIWEIRNNLKNDVKLFPYLITSVRNKCYNHIRDKQTEQKYINYTQQEIRNQVLDFEYEDVNEELIEKLHEVIESLPDKCREVFRLSKFERLSHKEIAAKLSISTKTVEKHITKAIKVLKAEMISQIIIMVLIVGDFL